ncbi:MAG TPA: histidine phosphatase family protein [Candidatus Acidoferrales bacterium]|nr:histidine phosphatase family protein [Candidatus Acidoferrales bacterium]
MGHLLFVRHAQGSFLGRNYDKLSQTGETQARLLGDYWARHQLMFDRVYSGPRTRQAETARIVGEAYRRAGLSWPDPVVMEEFDEYQADAVLEQALPRLLESSSHVRELHRAFQRSGSSGEKLKNFQRIYEVVISQWVNGELPRMDVESWAEFCARVRRGVSQVSTARGRGEQVVIFSSGGPVGVALQRALDLSPQATLRVAWMVRNSAFSEFLFSGERFTLSTFNAFPHLDDASLLTYR